MVFTSPFPSLPSPVAQDLPTFVFEHAAKHSIFGVDPTLPALTDHQVTQSFKEVQDMANSFASGLVSNLGLARGDAVAVLIPNTAYYAAIVLGIHMAGLVCATANPAYTVGEMAHVLKLSEAKAVVATKDNRAVILDALASLGLHMEPRHIMTIDGQNSVHSVLSSKTYVRMRITSNEEAKSTPALLLLSSGTTGQPKGVLLSHSNIVIPPIVIQLAKSPIVDKHDLSSFVFICSGAAPLSRETQIEVKKRLGCFLVQTYGLSETSPTSHRSPVNGTPDGSVGYLAPSMECIIAGEQGHRLGVGKVGEVCLRGPNIMMGYYKNALATSQTIDADGFLHTGDIGRVDANGFYYIVDRRKELIKVMGFQVAPAELEGLLMEHPAVLDAAVIGVVDKARESEVPKAFVVVRPGVSQVGLSEAIKGWISGRVAHYKALRGGVEIVAAIPKSASGKILRRVLRSQSSKAKI
ncbi:hypothetical protein H4R26_001365 [Coemansia thaxteri]|uniref:Acetyl-CoA synthetase-like protein n=1 Tax=Coemansia thaxteri TaxID=2663907 RepID=A0A9W8BGN7_9FUNG|nr:hypothetical protein H4R26_001365 [Coemansia thaxteri]